MDYNFSVVAAKKFGRDTITKLPGLPSSFNYVVLAVGQDTGGTEIFLLHTRSSNQIIGSLALVCN